MLTEQCERKDIAFEGTGDKTYGVFVVPNTKRPFSRPVNTELFVSDSDQLEDLWNTFLEALERERKAGNNRVSGLPAQDVDRIFYTAVAGYAAAVDLFKTGDRSTPGTFFEMIVGPAISVLTGYQEGGHEELRVPSGGVEKVTTDLTFRREEAPAILVVATKITTRERIQQAFVHQRILDAARPKEYRSVLGICSETNVAAPTGVTADERTYDICSVKETLVPGTIALYQNYLAPLDGLYYLDPPERYLAGGYNGLPPVRRFSSLFVDDLPSLLEPIR